jgi:hypothetical protein
MLFVLGLASLLTACHCNPNFNEEGLKSLLKEKAEIIMEDSLSIIYFEWSAAIGDYSEDYTIECSLNDHEKALNQDQKNKWQDLEKFYQLLILPATMGDTLFVFLLDKYSQNIYIQIAED